MITYNDIYDLLRKEKYSEQLQLIKKEFMSDVAEYLKSKKEVSEKEKDIFSDAIIKTKKQFENAIALINELMMIRKKKILNMAFLSAETGISKRDFENMLPFEQDLFNSIIKAIELSDQQFKEIINGESKTTKNNILVMFNEEVPSFLDMDGNVLGPFKEKEIANLPKEIVKILEQDKKVTVINDYD